MSAALPEAVLGNVLVAAVLAVFAAAAGRWGRRPAVTHALWLLVLVKLVTPPVIAVPVRLLPAQEEAAPLTDLVSMQAPPVQTAAVIQAAPASVGPVAPAVEHGLVPVAILPAPAVPAAHLSPVVRPFPWETVVLFLWLTGSISWLALAVVRVRRFTRLLNYSLAAPDEFAREVAAVSRRVGLARGPRVRIVPGAISPLVWSVGRPTLYFPAGLLDRLSPGKRAALVAHELAHLRRGDHWVRWLELAVLAAYWWCPLAWAARRGLRDAEEECCDAWVTHALPGAGPDYATALLDTIDFLADARVPAMATGIGDAASLRARLVGILADPRPARLSGPFKLGVIVLGVGLLPLGPTLARLAASPRVDVEAEVEKPVAQFVPVPRGESVQFADTPVSLAQAAGPCHAAAASPDGRQLALAAGNALVVLNRASGKLRFTSTGHADLVSSVAYSPDGQTIATGSYDGTIRLWSAADGRRLGTLRGHTSWVTAVAFAPDGKTLASGGYDPAVRLWDVATQKPIRTLTGPTAGVRCVAFSPDGTLLAAAGVDPAIRVWDAATGDARSILAGHTATVRALAFALDGKLLASGSDDRAIHFWDAAAGKDLGAVVPTSDPVTAAAFSPGGRVLLAGTSAGRVLNIDPAARRLRGPLGGSVSAAGGPVRTAAHAEGVAAVLFAGGPAVSVSQDGMALAWAAAAPPAAPDLAYLGHTAPVTAVAVSADGRTLAAGAFDGSIRVWDAATGITLKSLTGHLGTVVSLAFSPDGRRLVSAGRDETVRVWDVAAGQSIKVLTQSKPLAQVALAPDGKTAALACAGLATFGVYDLETGRLIKKLLAPGPVTAVAFSPDGAALATGTAEGQLSLWDLSRWEERHRSPVRDQPCRIDRIAFARDGRSAMVVLNDTGPDREPAHEVAFWNPADGSVREDAPRLTHAAPVADAAFTPDGAGVVTAGHDGRVYVWDAAAGGLLRQLHGHADAIAAVAAGPDGSSYSAGEAVVGKWQTAGPNPASPSEGPP